MTLFSGNKPTAGNDELFPVERSTSPTAPMNLLLRFETINGPRTVIACSVPLQTAKEVADAMLRAGQHAEFIDRCAPLSIADRLMMKKLSSLPLKPEKRRSNKRSRPQQSLQDSSIVTFPPPAFSVAAE